MKIDGKGFGLHALRVGRDVWHTARGNDSGLIIQWRLFLMSEADAFGLMNYLMGLKWWEPVQGEAFLFDHFRERRPIAPDEYLAWRGGELKRIAAEHALCERSAEMREIIQQAELTKAAVGARS